MRRFVQAEEGVSAVLGTIMLVAVAIVLAGGLFVLVMGFDEHVGRTPPSIALTTDGARSGRDAWEMGIAKVIDPHGVDGYIFILRTPQNGTLVAAPSGAAFDGTRDFFFQLGSSAGTGVHADNETTVGVDGLGGFRIALGDLDGNSGLGGGDHISIYYDGDGDQAHAGGRDDLLPGGAYVFEIKSRLAERYVALEERHF